ncbi:MAG: L-glutamate gamma-semialdehyde dehydrogenase [Acidobacteria bacterium]|nr:L-glutamate gamma-semialdehyde dehydrogenase [Acidobacteriota bacterium]
MLPPFHNEPLLDFQNEANAGPMRAAIDSVQAALGGEYSPIVAGARKPTGDLLRSVNPSNFGEVVGHVHLATREMAGEAIEAASTAFASWSKTPAEVRARYLLKFAAMLRRRKAEFAAWLVYEVGKSWVEADIDVAEAIDFAELYAREMVRYSLPQPLTHWVGEQNELYYIPLGVGIVIPPWNFPLAITVGMTVASIVAGNTVVLKPSSDSPVIAAKFVELLEEAGLPPGVVNFLPGSGAKIGDYMVEHPKTRFIAFTGSREVGLRIFELSAKTSPGQIWMKRLVAEMGGKNAMIVDETADLAAAAADVVIAGYCYSGQKCSACSRMIATAPVYDEIVARVVEGASKLTVGPVKDPANWMGPVVSKNAFQTILNYIEIGKGEGRVALGGGVLSADQAGWFIQPTVIADVAPTSRVAQEEIFGPVVAAIKARDFDDALAIANGTEYGLTGSLFSNDRARLERARREFHVGNLYFNRKCTGALVDVQPFGGFNMSGTDSKAGSREYVSLFLQGKSVSERL